MRVRRARPADGVVLASCFGDEDTGGGLFALDGNGAERLDRLSSTGLALAGDRLLRALRSGSEPGAGGELLRYDERGVERYYRLDALADVHDLAWHDGTLVAAATSANALFWLSAAGEIERTWKAPGEGDAWHLNGLAVHDGALFVCAFGRFAGHRDWTDGRAAGTGFLLDLASGTEVARGLSMPHTPRFFDGCWAICNSAEAEVLQIDPATGKLRRRLQLEGWTRGMAVGEELIFVGESANRTDPSWGDTARVAVVSRRTWSLVDRVALPAREVYDLVLAPPSLVDGARTGFRTNRLRVAEQDQYRLFDEVGVEPLRLWASGDALPRSALRARIEASVPGVLEPHALVEVDCVVENLGNAFFVSAPPHPVVASYKWIEAASGRQQPEEGLRSPLPRALPPRQPVACKVLLRTPAAEGDFTVRLTLVQEQVAWFDDVDAESAYSQRVRVQRRG